MDSWSEPIRRDTLTDSVMQRIKQMVLDREVAPGAWLPPQTEMAASFGVGLSTVREATRGLALMGILKPQPGRGTQVSDDALVSVRMMELVRQEMDQRDARVVHEARRLIESSITGLAAERATEEDIERIEAALRKMQQSLGDESAFAEADLEFHHAVARAARNHLIEDFYRIILEMLSEVLEQMVRIPGLKQRGIDYQWRILEAIRASDPQTARDLANDNIVDWDRILAMSQNSD